MYGVEHISVCVCVHAFVICIFRSIHTEVYRNTHLLARDPLACKADLAKQFLMTFRETHAAVEWCSRDLIQDPPLHSAVTRTNRHSKQRKFVADVPLGGSLTTLLDEPYICFEGR